MKLQTSSKKPTSATKCLVILTFLSSSSFLSTGASSKQPEQDSTVNQQAHPPATQLHLNSNNRVTIRLRPITQQQHTTTRPNQSQAPTPIVAGAERSAASTTNPSATTTTTTTTTSRLDNTWIESILIQVERLNRHSEEQLYQKLAPAQSNASREQSAAGDEEDDASQSAASSSLAPTDSGEDPLESTTTVASPMVKPTVEQPLISLSSIVGSNGSSEELQSSATQYSIGSPSSLGQTTDLELPSDIEDSNSVRAAVHSATESSRSDDNIIQLTTSSSRQPVGCEQAYTQCALRKACAPALKAYNDDCQELINNRTSQCSSRCLRAMIALRSSEEGDDLVDCDCQGNEYCLRSKRRSEACRPQVEQAVDPKTVVSCSTATWICSADQLCSTALEYYYRNCQSLFSQRHCSMRCNNSLSILYRQPKASKLINCHCDGSEEFPCVKYKTYTERLCLNKLSPTEHQIVIDPADLSNGNSPEDQEEELTAAASSSVLDSDNNNTDGSSEDDGSSNMTNDPETFVLGGEDEDDSDGPKVEAAEESTAGGPNGIQSVDDNWYPLVSGRFFSNLNHQRQQQHYKQNRYKQQQQVNLSSQRKSQPQRQQQRKLNKGKSVDNNSGSGHHDNGRRRYNRILAFASTSSAAPSSKRSHWITLPWTSFVAIAFVVVVRQCY